MWRLRLFFERTGWKWVLIAGAVLVALVAAGVVVGITRGGDEKAATTTTLRQSTTTLFYLRALAPKVRLQGCTMNIRFTWKPDYNADKYFGTRAVITASGTGIGGSYTKQFVGKPMSLDVGPIPLGGAYQIWTAKVTSLDGDPPGNDTTISAAPPSSAKCG
jgi:hypothetical protein